MASFKPTFNIDDINLVDSNVDFKSFLEVRTLYLKHKKFDAGETDLIKRELLVKPKCISVVIYDSSKDLMLFVEQVRFVNLLENSQSKEAWYLECVAGMLNPNEDPLDTVVRETKEETGVDLDKNKIKFIYGFYPSIGSSNEEILIYFADTNLHTSINGKIIHSEEGEDIKLHLYKISEVKKLHSKNTFKSSAGIIGLLEFFRIYDNHS